LGRQNYIDKPEAIKTRATRFGYMLQVVNRLRNGEETRSLVEKTSF